MSTSIVITLDTRNTKKDGTFPLLMRVIHFGKSLPIPLGISLQEKDWDTNKRLIKSSYKGSESVTRLNNLLQKKKVEATDIINKLDELKSLNSLSVHEIRIKIQKKSDRNSFFIYMESRIEEMNEMNRIGNARSYQIALGVLRNFTKNKDLTFQELNYQFLTKFEKWHIGRGNTMNGFAAYLRTLKAIYNKAIKDGIVEKELYPFENYTIKLSKTRKRAIPLEEINKIINLQIEPNNSLFDARNFFIISFYMRGIPFADLAKMKISNLIGGRVHYQRQKTDKPYNIKITDEIQSILNLYINGKSKDDYVFPIIKRTELNEQYKDVEWARKRYNKKLKEIAKLCGIEENLTSYVSRHSFATRAKNLGVPIATISEMLGHADTKTTEIYLDSLQSDLMDEAHERIIR